MQSLKLNDIKPLVEVQEYSFYYFLVLCVVIFALVFGGSYLVFRWLKTRKKVNFRKEHFKFLENLNLEQTKKSAYLFTKYGATFKDDSQRHKEMFENITQRLEKYKYKKDVEKFSDEVKGYLNLYKGMIDV